MELKQALSNIQIVGDELTNNVLTVPPNKSVFVELQFAPKDILNIDK